MKGLIIPLKLIIYYSIIAKMPHSRFNKIFNLIRVFYVSKILGIMKYHKETYFEPNIYIANGNNLKIGLHCQLNENLFIQGAQIGNYVMIAPNVTILSKTHNYSDISIPMILQGAKSNLIPIIEDDVWIGRNVIIMPGITIGSGSIIGAGSIVNKNVEPYSVMGGVPAKLIRKRR